MSRFVDVRCSRCRRAATIVDGKRWLCRWCVQNERFFDTLRAGEGVTIAPDFIGPTAEWRKGVRPAPPEGTEAPS